LIIPFQSRIAKWANNRDKSDLLHQPAGVGLEENGKNDETMY